MQNVVLFLMVGLAGAVGAILRFGISQLSKSALGEAFPWGTLLVNLIGCFLLGMIMSVSEESLSPRTKSIVGAGFLGALTTFSTFGLETCLKLEEGAWLLAFSNVLANVLLGLILAGVGIWAGKSWIVAG